MKEATIMLSIIGFQEYVQLYQNSSTGNINGVAQEYYPSQGCCQGKNKTEKTV